MMDEASYRLLVDKTLRRIDDAFADVDPDLVECSMSQGALTLLFRGGVKAIVSPQPPVRQMWLAFRDRAWHFDYDAAGGAWRDDRGEGLELLALLAQITEKHVGVHVALGG